MSTTSGSGRRQVRPHAGDRPRPQRERLAARQEGRGLPLLVRGRRSRAGRHARQLPRSLVPPSLPREAGRPGYNPGARYPTELERVLIESVRVAGASGRVGSAISARLRERGVALRDDGAEPCSSASRTRRSQTWRGRSSPVRGSRTRAARHRSPRSTRTSAASACTRCRRSPSGAEAEQLDGAYAAVSAESVGAQDVGFWLARVLGLEAFPSSTSPARSTTPARRSRRTTS